MTDVTSGVQPPASLPRHLPVAVLPCPYLQGREARWAIHLAATPPAAAELDALLAAGYRRHGMWFYRPRCPSCQACVPLRVPAVDFRPSRSQRRTLARIGELQSRLLASPHWSASHTALLARYLEWRHGLEAATAEDMSSSFFPAGFPTRLLELWRGDELVAAMVIDWGEVSASAVYSFYAPASSPFGLGTASILHLLGAARMLGLSWVYLGLWIDAHPKMHYKTRFRPHERLIDGRWRRFEAGR